MYENIKSEILNYKYKNRSFLGIKLQQCFFLTI